MKDRKVKGEPVVYTRVGETFVAKDGKTYRAVPDQSSKYACDQCELGFGVGECGRHRCVGDDRADGIGVHFVRVEE